MKNLPKFDEETICYIIDNKISPKDCEKILNDNKDKIANTGTTNNSSTGVQNN